MTGALVKKLLLWSIAVVQLIALSVGAQTFKINNLKVNGTSQFNGSSNTFTVRPTFNGNTPWDSGNFNPSIYATVASPTFTGSVTIPGGSINNTTVGLITPAAIVGTYVAAMGGSSPSTATSLVQNWVNAGIISATFVDSSRSANNHFFNIEWTNSIASFSFENDAVNSSLDFLTASGGFATGITGITSNSGSGVWAHTGGASVSGAFSANSASFSAPLVTGSGGTGVTSSTGTGSVVLSANPTFAGTVGGNNTIPLSVLTQNSSNSVVGNATNVTANNTSVGIPSCSGSTNALTWTSGTGFGCNTVASGTGQVNSATSGQLAGYTATGNIINGLPNLTFSAGALTHGVASSVAGSSIYNNTSSGSLTVQPPTGVGLGSSVLTLPNVIDTLTANTATQTLSNKTLASPTLSGSVSGNNTIPFSILVQNAANTILGNTTAALANNAALSVPSCVGGVDALTWTANTGFTCNAAINAAQLAGATPSTLSIGGNAVTATNVVGGAANQIPYQTAANTTSFITNPVSSGTCLQWSGSSFQWATCGSGGSGGVTSFGVSGGTTGLGVTGSPITTSGTITIGGVLGVANGGTQSNQAHQLLVGEGSAVMASVPTLTPGNTLYDQGVGADPKFQSGAGIVLTGADPTGVADSTAIIQAAVNNIVTNGLHLIIPAGTYKITAAINIPFGFGWKITGAARGGTTITQFTSNTPIFKFATGSSLVGSTTVGPFSWAITDLHLTYNTPQTSANVNGDAFFFTTNNNVYFNCEISRITFDNGFEGIAEDPTTSVAVWGCGIRDNVYAGTNTGSYIQLAHNSAGQENLEIDGAYVSANSIVSTEPVINILSNDSGSYNHIEINNLLNGGDLMYMSGAGTIGSVKCEICTWNGGGHVFQFPNAHFTIGFLAIENTTINATGNSVVGIDVSAGGATSTITVGNVNLSFSSAIVGNFYLANAGNGSPNFNLRFINSPQGLLGVANAYLVNVPASLSDQGVSIGDWQQSRLTTDNANTNATWKAGQPNYILYNTPLTANHTIQVLDNDEAFANTNMYNGLPLCVIRTLSATGAFTLTLQNNNGTTLGTQTVPSKLCVIWNRTNGWQIYDYQVYACATCGQQGGPPFGGGGGGGPTNSPFHATASCSAGSPSGVGATGSLLVADTVTSDSLRVYNNGTPVTINYISNAASNDNLNWTIQDATGYVIGSGSFGVGSGSIQTPLTCTINGSGYFAATGTLQNGGGCLASAGTRPACIDAFGVLPNTSLPAPTYASPDQHRFGLQNITNTSNSGALYNYLGATWNLVNRSQSFLEPNGANTYTPNINDLPSFNQSNLNLWVASRLDGLPGWDGNNDSYTLPTNQSAFSSFMGRVGSDMAAIRSHYYPTQQKNYYQVTWEPSIGWVYPTSNFVTYYSLVYPNIHNNDPNAVVMGVTNPFANNNNQSTGTWIQQYQSSGLCNYLDGVTTHSYYNSGTSPINPPEKQDQQGSPANLNSEAQEIRNLRSIMQNCKPNMRLWDTEMGISYDPGIAYGSAGVSQNQLWAQAMVAIRTHIIILGEGAQVTFGFFGIDCPASQCNNAGYGHFFDVLNSNGYSLSGGNAQGGALSAAPKPKGMAFAALSRILDGTTTVGYLNGSPSASGIYGYAFQQMGSGKMITAMWVHQNSQWPTGGSYSQTYTVSYNLTVDSPGINGSVTVIDAFGNPQTVNYTNGMVNLTLSEAPIFVVSNNLSVIQSQFTAPVGYTGQ
jgi:hypothetical protein